MKNIARAVKELEVSVAMESELESAARHLAYDCLRVVILGAKGLDIESPSSAKLVRESLHFCRKRVRQRLNMRMRELRAALHQYPNVVKE